MTHLPHSDGAPDSPDRPDSPRWARLTQLRPATPGDAVRLSALAIQVYLDTYATQGVSHGLAQDALTLLSCDAFAERARQPHLRLVLAERGDGLIGFAELDLTAGTAPGTAQDGAELVRLYVQPTFQRAGVGSQLIEAAEQLARAAQRPALWLTAWDGNHRARAFYAGRGYADVGATVHWIEGQPIGNRVLMRLL